MSNEALSQTDPRHSLLPIQLFVDWLRHVKADPSRVVVGVLDGPTEPFSVVVDTQTGAPQLQPSCSAGNGTFGGPAVRIKQVVESIAVRGLSASICQNAYTDVMAGFAIISEIRTAFD